jgi:hypothetical protein
MEHTVLWPIGWALAFLKLATTALAVWMKRNGKNASAMYHWIFILTKATPPAFVLCFLADALAIHDADGVRIFSGLLVLVIVLLAAVFYLRAKYGFDGLVKARVR